MHSCDINHENIINIKLDRSMYVEVLTVVHDWCRNPSKLVVFLKTSLFLEFLSGLVVTLNSFSNQHDSIC